MADPSPRHPTWRGMTVRAPPLGHRVPTYPWPPRPGRRVSAVCVPWRLPPSPCRPDSTGCARRACPASLPIPAPRPTHQPTQTLPPPARHHSHHLNSHSCLPRRHSRENGNPRPPVARGGYREDSHRQPADYPTTPPTKCILPSKYRPTRGLAPPRPRASHANAILAPRPCPPTENQPILVRSSPLHMVERGRG